MVHTVTRVATVLVLCFGMLLGQGTWVLAGTTGSVAGIVTDASTHQPVASARVTAASPSQTVSTTSDASGHFAFVSLAPDTYTITATSNDHETASISGVTVLADQALTVDVAQPSALRQIGAVTSRSSSALVKPGTTSDVYSVGAVAQDKAAALGGGGTLNSAWSAISSVPGVFVASNQTGYIGAAPTLSIRGGDYDQIGYELDGVPVNRSFDNYPSSVLSSLGQQELQVYTGATPANAEASGLSGYINQVIRTGTAPASRTLDLAVGAPALYNKAALETGGANPSRTFSYYFGAGAYDQDFRTGDQFNGAALSQNWGVPLAQCYQTDDAGLVTSIVSRSSAPSCYDPSGRFYGNAAVGQAPTAAYALGPFNAFTQAQLNDRDAVLNLHFGIPQRSGNRDDVQVLFDENHIGNVGYTSTNDQGGDAYLNAIGFGTPAYADGYQTTIPYGTVLPAGYAGGGGVATYLFPGSPTGRPFGAAIPPDQRDQFVNDQSVVKVQYQHNFGTSAFLRVYGYTYYSDWLNVGAQDAIPNYVAFQSPEYELNSHSRGLSAQFSDQITPQHLVSLQGSYTTASSLRYNNSGFGRSDGTVGYLVNGSDPYSGTCYTLGGAPVVGCNQAGTPFGTFTLQQQRNGTVAQPTAATCGSGPCQYVVVAGGPSASYNTIVPKFSAVSITDNWTPASRLTVNAGLRLDRFEFDGADTYDSGARTLFFNAYNLTHPSTPLLNTPSQVATYTELQPRAGFTYTLDPRTVVRASYGRYAQAPNSAFEQYNYLQPNSTGLLGTFVSLGLANTPGHAVRPEVSNNYDLSLEHQFRGDLSLKLTPFLRKTQDQIQNFFLDERTGFQSGLNVGRQTSQGVELEVDKGDFARNGLSGRLSFTYTNSYINYGKLDNGTTIVDPINAAISQYNAYTKAGGGAPCYRLSGDGSTPGAADFGCGAGSVANPYYNAPSQGLLDANGSYTPYSTFPGGIGTSVAGIGAPYVATAIVQYKHGALAITPALQVSAGARYGAPQTWPGIQPDLCTALLASPPTGDTRYSYGASGGGAYDARSCAAGIAIPEPFTNRFDGIGSLVEPTQLQLHLQVSYDVNRRITLVGNFANLINRCFGGSQLGYTVSEACGYTVTPGAGSGPQPVGNVYNPGDAIQPELARPYVPAFGVFPFNMYLEARLKL